MKHIEIGYFNSSKIIVGNQVLLKNINDRTLLYDYNKLTVATVTHVGRLYFTVMLYNRKFKFSIVNGKQHTSQNPEYVAYYSKHHYNDVKDVSKLFQKVQNLMIFNENQYTKRQLDQVLEILNEL